MVERRYPGTLTPVGQFDDSTNQNFGSRFHFTAAQAVDGYAVYSPTAQTATLTLYEAGNSTIVDRKTSVSLATGWNYVAFSAPVSLTANKTYFVFSTMRYYAVIATGDGSSSPYTDPPFSGGIGSVDGTGEGVMSILNGVTTPIDAPIAAVPGGGFQPISNWTGVAVYVDEDIPPALTVNAGVDQSVETGDLVTMTATDSDADGTVTWEWEQTSGPTASLSSTTTASTTFTPGEDGTYVFTVTGTDSSTSDDDSIAITVTDPVAPPTLTVNAGSDQTSVAGSLVTLTATPANANGAVTWEWVQTSGATVELSSTSTASTTFTPSAAGNYSFTVTGTDSATSDDDLVAVTVTPAPPPSGAAELWANIGGTWTKLDFGSAGAATEPHVFHVDSYGAVGDGTTDDTAAIQSAIDAAFAAAPDHNYNVEVRFGSKEYLVSTPGVDGQEYGYAQLRIPFWSASADGRKIMMTFRGAGDAAQLPYWDQDQPVSAGTVLKSTWNGDADGDYGIPSVLGGPTVLSPTTGAPQDDIVTYSNMKVTIDGIQIQIPHNAALGGFDLRKVAQANMVNGSVVSNRVRNSSPSMALLPTNDHSYGYMSPTEGNNAINDLGYFMAAGVSIGVIAQEHISADTIAVIYARYGLVLQGNGNGQQWPNGTQRLLTHNTAIRSLLCEAVNYWVSNSGSTGQVQILALSGEGITNFVAHVNDPNNLLTGQMNFADIYNETPTVIGAKRLRIVSDGVTRGHRTAPSVPTSGTDLVNPFWRDVAVNVSGGTVADISVEGASTGLTSGTFVLGPNQEITLTYSSAPSWNWTVL